MFQYIEENQVTERQEGVERILTAKALDFKQYEYTTHSKKIINKILFLKKEKNFS